MAKLREALGIGVGLAALCFVAAAATYFVVFVYKPDSVENDTSDRYAVCGSAAFLKVELIGIRPGEKRRIHSGMDCPIFDRWGRYVACIHPGGRRDGLTFLVSSADADVEAESCLNSDQGGRVR